MAKRKAPKRKRATSMARKRTPKRASGRRPITKRRAKARSVKKRPRSVARKKARSATSLARKRATRRTSAARKRAVTPKTSIAGAGTARTARLDRARRTLEESVPTPPSSLDMNRRGTAVRTGRAEVAQSLHEHRGMSPDITGGDVDVDVEDAYFNGDEAPGGDNPTPDQDIVDDIGKALGVEYQDNEELKASDKVKERDRKRWELDPASSEDYKERK
jgi:Family of unknown function (DUF6335)